MTYFGHRVSASASGIAHTAAQFADHLGNRSRDRSRDSSHRCMSSSWRAFFGALPTRKEKRTLPHQMLLSQQQRRICPAFPIVCWVQSFGRCTHQMLTHCLALSGCKCSLTVISLDGRKPESARVIPILTTMFFAAMGNEA